MLLEKGISRAAQPKSEKIRQDLDGSIHCMETNHEIPKADKATPRLLLSSLAEFWSLIEPALAVAKPKMVCEIGIGQGEFARLLLNFCANNHCRYTGIDPALDASAEYFQNADAKKELFREPSLKVLAKLPPQDVYFVDGDHNYFTVLEELRAICKRNHGPLIFLHDVCWPWGRRDHYCAPDLVPEEFRHAHSTDLGVVPGRSELAQVGFSGETSEYKYGAALHDGGPRNGVLTAAEDFLKEQPTQKWKLVIVPVIFGLGILYLPERCTSPAVEQIMRIEKSVAPLKTILELLERNRGDLFQEHLTKMRDLATIHGHYTRLKQAYESLNMHSKDLLANYNALLQHTNSLQSAYEDLAREAFGLTGSSTTRP